MDYLEKTRKFLAALCYDLSRFTIKEDPTFAEDMGATVAVSVQDRKSLGTVYLMVYSTIENLRGMTVQVDRYGALNDSPDDEDTPDPHLGTALETLAEKLQKTLIWYAESDEIGEEN